MRKLKEYAYYRGDEFVMIDTIQEIAEASKYKVKTVEGWRYPSQRKRSCNVLVEV
ncbi:hypothetical protein [uncultured Streptococcus sp.]|uniref:hypothetical protein n=1 Tax=uncultured Streptococcus sp. TaxID=83427 RepID=UPI00261958DF|nr:hypothetical protein [uncultured Streptococcus sp.]